MAERPLRLALRLGSVLGLIVSGWATAWAAEGVALFSERCEACHQEGGVGAPGLAPPLASPAMAVASADYVPLVLLSGLSGPLGAGVETFPGPMPPFDSLSDTEIAALVNLVRQDLNGIASAGVTPADVARLRPGAPREPGDLIALRKGKAP